MFHSMLIGLALGVTGGTSFTTLLIALSFHQVGCWPSSAGGLLAFIGRPAGRVGAHSAVRTHRTLCFAPQSPWQGNC